jgi:hypothetical protein
MASKEYMTALVTKYGLGAGNKCNSLTGIGQEGSRWLDSRLDSLLRTEYLHLIQSTP